MEGGRREEEGEGQRGGRELGEGEREEEGGGGGGRGRRRGMER